MKRFAIAFLALAATAAPLFAQEKTLFSDGITSHGGFGGPVTKVTRFNGETVVMGGIRGGWIINHHFSLGFGGYGLSERSGIPQEAMDLYKNADGTYRDMRTIFGYGGLEAEYTGRWEELVHYTAGLLVGAGNVEYAEHNDTWDGGDFNRHDSIFVLEPSLSGELNVIRWMRVNLGVSYRLVTDVNQVGLNNKDVSGIAGTINFKFGKF